MTEVAPPAAPPRSQTPLRIVAIVLAAAATAGLVFAAFSTAEFAQHLDRQVHDIHCSFIPGEEAESEEVSGCEVAMMSPYSSVLRTKVWGGLPIALPAMGIFAFLLWRALDLILRKEGQRKAAANFLIVTAVGVAAMPWERRSTARRRTRPRGEKVVGHSDSDILPT